MNGQITGVTILKDESLGGVSRVYRVLIVNANCSFGHYDEGDVITITEVIAADPFILMSLT